MSQLCSFFPKARPSWIANGWGQVATLPHVHITKTTWSRQRQHDLYQNTSNYRRTFGNPREKNNKFAISGLGNLRLRKFVAKNKKSSVEKIEDIEILRFFDYGIKIKMVKLNSNSVAVDELKDVKKAEKILKKKNRWI